MKLGDKTVVLAKKVPTGQRDKYGNPAYTLAYTVLRWCEMEPTRTKADETRSAPAISGATLMAPASAHDVIGDADHLIWPAAQQPDGTWTGNEWVLVGEIGRWEDFTEVQLRRLT